MSSGTDWDEGEQQSLSQVVGEVFTPASPIRDSDLFAGRRIQLERVFDAINERGRHVVLFGERGVGKTSLANIVSDTVRDGSGRVGYAKRVACSATDTYPEVWRGFLRGIGPLFRRDRAGLRLMDIPDPDADSHMLEQTGSPREICETLELLGEQILLAPIFDEFERIQSDETRRLMADTIKALSDQGSRTTIIIVGVADSVGDLVEQHESIERALVQVLMPRMTHDELQQIFVKAAERLQMQIDADAGVKMAFLARGLPHYAHLLGKHSFRHAMQERRRRVTGQDIRPAIETALNEVEHSIRTAYDRATSSSHTQAIYGQVLAACALAECDDLGWFRAASVSAPLSKIKGKPYRVEGFASHLGRFASDRRGGVLERAGDPHNRRYRFVNPLMQPYAVLMAIKNGYAAAGWEQLLT